MAAALKMNYPALKGGVSDFSSKNLSLDRKLSILRGFIPRNLGIGKNFALKGGVLHPRVPIKPELYTTMLRFFRSAAFTVETLYHTLIRLVMAHVLTMKIDGRLVLLADHIKISKEGLRMPCVQKWHQESQNSGKGEYIEGHNFGIVSMLAEAGKCIRSIPVMAEIHESKARTKGESIIGKMARMMGNIAKTAGKGAIGVCDACFFSKTMLDTAASFLDKNGKQLLHIITRAKKNAAGFMPPSDKNTSRRRGRPGMYGKRISLGTCFRMRRKEFTDAVMKLYNKERQVRFLCLDLLWKPVKRTVRFVLTEMNGKHFILMSSDIRITAEHIIYPVSVHKVGYFMDRPCICSCFVPKQCAKCVF